MAWLRRLMNLGRTEQLSRELDREIAFHVAERADALEREGMSPEAALREARHRFGDATVLKERAHDANVIVGLESLGADLRYAARALRASPGFTAVAVLSLGLGIGANTAIFSLINAVVLRTLPVPAPEQLIRVTMGRDGATFTNPLWEAIRSHRDVFASAYAYGGYPRFNLTDGGEVHRAAGNWVSGDYFTVLGIRPVAGRLLTAADDVRGCPALAVVGADFAARELGGVASAPGQSLSLDGYSFQVIGVVPPSFTGLNVGRASEVFVPLCAEPLVRARSVLDARSSWFLDIGARLAPGATLTQARAALRAISPAVFDATVPTHWTAKDQAEYRAFVLDAEPAPRGVSRARDRYGQALLVLLAVVGVVLLIACANVAQLLLARAARRQREIAVRLAIGAGRARLIRQLLTESLVLAAAGAGLGVLFARWSSGLLVRMLGGAARSVQLDLSLDLRVLAFTAGVAVLTGLLFGLVPAWRAVRIAPLTALKANARGVFVGGFRSGVGSGLVVVQVALSLLLVTGSGLLLRSFQKMMSVDAGFEREGVVLATVDFERTGWTPERRAEVHRSLLTRLREIPGIRSASVSAITPISGTFWNDFVEVEGFVPKSQRESLVWFNTVSDGYFATLRTELLAGRDLRPSDGPGAPLVAVINQAMARTFFHDDRPLGRVFRIRSNRVLGPPITVVGVVEDAKYAALDEASRAAGYFPLAQSTFQPTDMTYAFRADVAPATLVPTIVRAAADAHPAISLRFTTLDAQVRQSVTRPRVLAALSAFFGGLALALAVIGLYGTMAYGVARRRTEIGVRIALGAQRRRVIGMILREAGRLVGLGVVIGGALALATTRLLRAFLFGLSPLDPSTLTMAALALVVAALAAGGVPAWRAARLDPVATLRED